MTTPDLSALPTLPAKVRRGIYTGYGLAVIVAGAVDTGYGDHDPSWLAVVLRVLTYLAVPVSALAVTNVSTVITGAPNPPADPNGL